MLDYESFQETISKMNRDLQTLLNEFSNSCQNAAERTNSLRRHVQKMLENSKNATLPKEIQNCPNILGSTTSSKTITCSYNNASRTENLEIMNNQKPKRYASKLAASKINQLSNIKLNTKLRRPPNGDENNIKKLGNIRAKNENNKCNSVKPLSDVTNQMLKSDRKVTRPFKFKVTQGTELIKESKHLDTKSKAKNFKKSKIVIYLSDQKVESDQCKDNTQSFVCNENTEDSTFPLSSKSLKVCSTETNIATSHNTRKNEQRNVRFCEKSGSEKSFSKENERKGKRKSKDELSDVTKQHIQSERKRSKNLNFNVEKNSPRVCENDNSEKCSNIFANTFTLITLADSAKETHSNNEKPAFFNMPGEMVSNTATTSKSYFEVDHPLQSLAIKKRIKSDTEVETANKMIKNVETFETNENNIKIGGKRKLIPLNPRMTDCDDILDSSYINTSLDVEIGHEEKRRKIQIRQTNKTKELEPVNKVKQKGRKCNGQEKQTQIKKTKESQLREKLRKIMDGEAEPKKLKHKTKVEIPKNKIKVFPNNKLNNWKINELHDKKINLLGQEKDMLSSNQLNNKWQINEVQCKSSLKNAGESNLVEKKNVPDNLNILNSKKNVLTDYLENSCNKNSAWCDCKKLHSHLLAHRYVPNNFRATLFKMQATTPDLRKIFDKISEHKLVRNSSAVWNVPTL